MKPRGTPKNKFLSALFGFGVLCLWGMQLSATSAIEGLTEKDELRDLLYAHSALLTAVKFRNMSLIEPPYFTLLRRVAREVDLEVSELGHDDYIKSKSMTTGSPEEQDIHNRLLILNLESSLNYRKMENFSLDSLPHKKFSQEKGYEKKYKKLRSVNAEDIYFFETLDCIEEKMKTFGKESFSSSDVIPLQWKLLDCYVYSRVTRALFIKRYNKLNYPKKQKKRGAQTEKKYLKWSDFFEMSKSRFLHLLETLENMRSGHSFPQKTDTCDQGKCKHVACNFFSTSKILNYMMGELLLEKFSRDPFIQKKGYVSGAINGEKLEQSFQSKAALLKEGVSYGKLSGSKRLLKTIESNYGIFLFHHASYCRDPEQGSDLSLKAYEFFHGEEGDKGEAQKTRMLLKAYSRTRDIAKKNKISQILEEKLKGKGFGFFKVMFQETEKPVKKREIISVQSSMKVFMAEYAFYLLDHLKFSEFLVFQEEAQVHLEGKGRRSKKAGKHRFMNNVAGGVVRKLIEQEKIRRAALERERLERERLEREEIRASQLSIERPIGRESGFQEYALSNAENTKVAVQKKASALLEREKRKAEKKKMRSKTLVSEAKEREESGSEAEEGIEAVEEKESEVEHRGETLKVLEIGANTYKTLGKFFERISEDRTYDNEVKITRTQLKNLVIALGGTYEEGRGRGSHAFLSFAGTLKLREQLIPIFDIEGEIERQNQNQGAVPKPNSRRKRGGKRSRRGTSWKKQKAQSHVQEQAVTATISRPRKNQPVRYLMPEQVRNVREILLYLKLFPGEGVLSAND